MNDPRVFFAAERTLLAWTRTSLAVMGFGFVVARFGLYLRMLADHPINPTHRLASTALGVALVLLGVIVTAAASVQYRRFVATLPTNDHPPRYSTGLVLLFSMGLTTLGAILAAYLIIWMNE
jgi:putative membrane protein